MNYARQVVGLGGLALLIAGCQTTPPAEVLRPGADAIQSAAAPATPTVPPVQVAPPPVVATASEVPAPPQIDAPPPAARDAQADIVARQAEAHAKAIEALLAGNNPPPNQSFVVEPQTSVPPAPVATNVPVVTPAPAQQPVAIASTAAPQPIQMLPAPDSSAVTPANAGETVSASMDTRSTQANTAVSVINTAKPSVNGVSSPVQAPSQPETLEGLIARRAAEYPRDLASQLDHQLVLFAKRQTVPRTDDLAQLASEDREVLTALLDGIVNFRSTIEADSNQLMNRKIRPLVEMADRLRARADLSIPNAVLCREVKGFGLYTPIESTRFTAGVAHRVIAYCEIENFSSQLNAEDLWETRIGYEIVLYTESGLPVWNEKGDVVDLCRNRRRDFFVGKVIELPANLNMGRYVLKLSVTDEQAKRIAETSIEIGIVAK